MMNCGLLTSKKGVVENKNIYLKPKLKQQVEKKYELWPSAISALAGKIVEIYRLRPIIDRLPNTETVLTCLDK